MKLLDFKDEQALDLLADLIEPASVIFGDTEVRKAMASGGSRAAAISCILKRHTKAVMKILAALDGVPVEEYHCNVFTLPNKLLEIFNDREVMSFFTSAPLMAAQTPFGSPTENTEAVEQ